MHIWSCIKKIYFEKHLPGVFDPDLSKSTTSASLLESLLILLSGPSLIAGLVTVDTLRNAKSSASSKPSVFGRFESLKKKTGIEKFFHNKFEENQWVYR